MFNKTIDLKKTMYNNNELKNLLEYICDVIITIISKKTELVLYRYNVGMNPHKV